jgi:hypothetical protein
MRRAGLAIAGVATIAAGCLLPEIGDFSGGSPDASTVLGNDASPKDTGADAPIVVADAGACPDGSFCDDFDDGPLGAKWTTKQEQDIELTLVDAGLSPPNALQLRFLPRTKAARQGFLSKAFPVTTAAHVVCSVQIKPIVRTTTSGQDYQVLLVQTAASASQWASVYVKLTPTATDVLEDHPGADGGVASSVKGIPTTGGGVATGAWSRLELDVDFAKKSAKLTVIGTATTSLTIPNLQPPANPSSITILLGEDGDSDDEPSTTLLDDLVCSLP